MRFMRPGEVVDVCSDVFLEDNDTGEEIEGVRKQLSLKLMGFFVRQGVAR